MYRSLEAMGIEDEDKTMGRRYLFASRWDLGPKPKINWGKVMELKNKELKRLSELYKNNLVKAGMCLCPISTACNISISCHWEYPVDVTNVA